MVSVLQLPYRYYRLKDESLRGFPFSEMIL